MARRPAIFTQDDIKRAFAGARDAGVRVAVLIDPTGRLAIVPAEQIAVPLLPDDLDARIDAFASG
ncbi:hypothetical protein [Sphingomonas sp. IW22]|uniref:hypothetical protein n=1 Tax=Sphingomonas sp. IW22 TaxID=3242489 RepID=UPI0035217292